MMKKLTVRDLMKKLVEMNPEASVQIQDSKNKGSSYTQAVSRVLYHTKSGKRNPKDADYVALLPD